MTLTEILVVLGIFALVAGIALPLFNPWAKGRRVREAARLVQAALIGARDRAIREEDTRGLIFVTGPLTDTWLNRFIYFTAPRSYPELLSAYDADSNGSLSSAEWPNYNESPVYQELFAALDTDSNGVLTEAEVAAAGGVVYMPLDGVLPVELPEGTRFNFTTLAGDPTLAQSGLRVVSDTSAEAGKARKLTASQWNRFLTFNATGTAEGPGQIVIYVEETSEVGDRMAVVLNSRTGLIEVYDVNDPNAPFHFVTSGATAGR